MMLILGQFVFELASTPYQALAHQTNQRWAANTRLGARAAYQHLGPGDDIIALTGVLYPGTTGGVPDLSRLRSMQASGQGYVLMGGNGRVFGLYIIQDLNETQQNFLHDGQPRKIEFSLNLTRIDDNRVDLIGDLVDDITQPFTEGLA